MKALPFVVCYLLVTETPGQGEQGDKSWEGGLREQEDWVLSASYKIPVATIPLYIGSL